MGKFLKPGKVVIVLSGRFAGRKAIIVKAYDEGTNEHKFPHALVTGIDTYPRRVTKSMSEKRILRRSRIKPFIKFINYNHLMPTRYSLSDVDFKTAVKADSIRKPGDLRVQAKKDVKKILEERYLNSKSVSGGSTFFFSKLRF